MTAPNDIALTIDLLQRRRDEIHRAPLPVDDFIEQVVAALDRADTAAPDDMADLLSELFRALPNLWNAVRSEFEIALRRTIQALPAAVTHNGLPLAVRDHVLALIDTEIERLEAMQRAIDADDQPSPRGAVSADGAEIGSAPGMVPPCSAGPSGES